MNRTPLALAALTALAGCAEPKNLLDGSIKQSHDLTFDRVELRYLALQTPAYQLSYFKNLDDEGSSFDTVAKLVFNDPQGGVIVDESVDLLAVGIDGVVERIMAKDDPFPAELTTANVTFLAPPVVGDTTNGKLAVTFANGKTLTGTFKESLSEASFD